MDNNDTNMLLSEIEANDNVTSLKGGFTEALRLVNSSEYEKGINKMQELAEAGNLNAQKEMAQFYAEGRFFPVDKKKAAQWFWEAAMQGDADSQRELALLYDTGEGVAKNLGQAFLWFSKAAEQADGVAMGKLAEYYSCGKGVEVNYQEALDWAMKGVEQNDSVAQYVLGELYCNGNGVSQNSEKAIKWFQKALDQGNIAAACYLGSIYINGTGVTPDVNKALQYFIQGERLGDPVSARNLGNMYYEGSGVEINRNEAFRLYLKAAELGVVEAMNNVGIMYMLGDGTACNEEQGVFWLEKAGKKGMLSAYQWLSGYYSDTESDHLDLDKSIFYTKKRALAKDADAQALMGSFYFSGYIDDVPNYTEAKKWLDYPCNVKNNFAMLYMSQIMLSEAGNDFDKQQSAFDMLVDVVNNQEDWYDAQIVLSEWYETGVAGHNDIQKARFMLEECFHKQDFLANTDEDVVGNAARRYGRMLYYGLGGSRDPKEGINFLNIAVNDYEDAGAMYELGVIYRDGQYVRKDKNLSEQMFQMASQRGFYGR